MGFQRWCLLRHGRIQHTHKKTETEIELSHTTISIFVYTYVYTNMCGRDKVGFWSSDNRARVCSHFPNIELKVVNIIFNNDSLEMAVYA